MVQLCSTHVHPETIRSKLQLWLWSLCRTNSCWCADPSIVSGDRWSNEWRCLLKGSWVKSWLPETRDEWFSSYKANIQYMYLVQDQTNTRHKRESLPWDEKVWWGQVPNTGMEEIEPFVQRMASVPRSGLHNPFKNPERPPSWARGIKLLQHSYRSLQ